VPALLGLPRAAAGLASPGDERAVRSLSLAHLHTHERLDVDYWSAGDYVPDGLTAVNRVLRDWRTDEIRAIDPALLDLLNDLVVKTGTEVPFEVISGYRSPATNRMLRSRSSGVAGSSLHMAGKAIDIRLADVPLKRLRDTAIALRRGGVGYYPSSDFVHVDTGRFRTW
jgi:uncharacterized protein YcbK (DUF882 family)